MTASAPYFSTQVSAASRFYFPQPTGKAFEIEAGGREECPKSYDIERENFPPYVIEFISRGTGRIQLGRESWKLPPGSLYVYNRDLPHRISSLSSGGMTKYFGILRGNGVRRVLASHGLIPGRVVQVSDQNRISEIWDDLVQIGSSSRRNRQAACAFTLRYLLLKIEDLTLSSEHLVSGSYSAYLKCLRFMEKHCLELTSVAATASACHLNQAYLCRLFKRFSDETPYHHLLRLRMAHAARVLKSTNRSARSLSEELGFSDAAAFSRAFKRTLGVSPTRSRLENSN